MPRSRTPPKLSAYEREQLRRIGAWRAAAPDALTRGIAKVTAPAGNAIQKIIPTAALRVALARVQSTAVRLGDRRSILKRAGVDRLEALRDADLETCDGLADHVRKRGMALAGGSGALFGVAGGLGLVADVPTLLVQTFRVIHRVGLCYGEDFAEASAQRLPIGVFALASANTLAEKQAALAAIEQATVSADTGWREGLERAAERELAKEAAVFSLNNLAQSVTRRLGLRKAASGLPILGALVGGAVNAWYLNEVARAAQATFQMRWLWRRHGEAETLDAMRASLAALPLIED